MTDENFKKAVILLLLAILRTNAVLATMLKAVARQDRVDNVYHSIWGIHDETEATVKALQGD